MKLPPLIPLLVLLNTSICTAQNTQPFLGARNTTPTDNETPTTVPPINQHLTICFEFNAFLDPIYGLQKSDNYKLNGQAIGTQSTAAFYVSQPGRHIFEHFADLT